MRCSALLVLGLLLALGCVLPGTLPAPEEEALRIRDLSDEGDPMRRAALDLLTEALGADAAQDASRARGLYARALQIDSSNPYAYLALARHHAEVGDARQAMQHLDRAEDLLRSYDGLSPRVEVHLLGLRGVAMQRSGRVEEGDAWVARAASIAPSVWGDGELTADELR